MTCIKGEIDEEQPQQQQIQPQTAQRPTTTQLNLHQQNPNTLQTLHSSSHLDFNCSPELTNLLLSDLGVAMPAGNEWLDDNLIKLWSFIGRVSRWCVMHHLYKWIEVISRSITYAAIAIWYCLSPKNGWLLNVINHICRVPYFRLPAKIYRTSILAP